jgi:hypothetical protein
VDDWELRHYAIQVLSPSGELLETWSMDAIPPRMLTCDSEGSIYLGGNGVIAKLTPQGEILIRLEVPEFLDGRYADAHVSGVTANLNHIYFAFGHGRSLRAEEDVVRFTPELTEPTVVAEQQFGCCLHIDLDTFGDELLIAENSRFRINRFSTEGELIERWGSRTRDTIEGFGACCNPVNFDLAEDGYLYTAESGLGRVKRFTPEGDFVDLVGYVDTTEFDQASRLAAFSCYIPIDVSPDGERVYIMDIRAQIIRVLARN